VAGCRFGADTPVRIQRVSFSKAREACVSGDGEPPGGLGDPRFGCWAEQSRPPGPARGPQRL